MFGEGPRLSERMIRLLTRGARASTYTSPIRVLGILASLAALAAGLSHTPRWIAFAKEQPAFEVASVKAVPLGAHAEPKLDISGSNFIAERYTVKDLMQWAYGREAWRISGPGWIDTQAFDIHAKAQAPSSQEEFRRMVQALLEDRFKLALRREQKTVSAYELSVGKDGLAIREVHQDARDGGRMGWTDGIFTFQMINRVSRLAQILPDFLDERPVLDHTGLTGVYDIALRVHMDPDQFNKMPQPGAVFAGFGYTPGVFDAVEQLGLKLEESRQSVEVLQVEHVQKPDEN